MADWIDLARDWGTSCEFVQLPEAALPCVVVLAACCSARRSSTASSPLLVAEAYGTNNFSSNSLMVLIFWLITPTASSSYTWRAFIFIASILVSSVAFSFPGLLRALGFEAGGDVKLLLGWVCERILRCILWLLSAKKWLILVS